MENIISNVVLVVVAISLALIIVFWATSIVVVNTGLEILEIKNKKLIKQSNMYIVKLDIENKGTKSVKIVQVLINNKPLKDYNATFSLSKDTVSPGETINLEIKLKAKTGTIIDVSIVTGRGIRHLTSIILS